MEKIQIFPGKVTANFHKGTCWLPTWCSQTLERKPSFTAQVCTCEGGGGDEKYPHCTLSERRWCIRQDTCLESDSTPSYLLPPDGWRQEIWTFVKKMLSLFDSTCLCEKTFSIMNINKSRMRLCDFHLCDVCCWARPGLQTAVTISVWPFKLAQTRYLFSFLRWISSKILMTWFSCENHSVESALTTVFNWEVYSYWAITSNAQINLGFFTQNFFILFVLQMWQTEWFCWKLENIAFGIKNSFSEL